MDMYMNSVYVVVIYLINIWILYVTDETADIVLNALAIEFIASLDEEVTSTDVWDEDEGRYMRAGAVELIIQGTLRLQWLKNSRLMQNKFNLPEKGVQLCNARQAQLDEKETEKYKLQTTQVDERVFDLCANAAEESNNIEAKDFFEDTIQNFGTVSRMLSSWGCVKSGIFYRYYNYRTWSEWEKVLYSSVLPRGKKSFPDKTLLNVAKAMEPNCGHGFENILNGDRLCGIDCYSDWSYSTSYTDNFVGSDVINWMIEKFCIRDGIVELKKNDGSAKESKLTR